MYVSKGLQRGHKRRRVLCFVFVKPRSDHSSLSTCFITSPQQPLLHWETLGPVVRAAATAHTDEVPAAVADIGTDLAAAAVNAVPSGNSRPTGFNQQQGVLVLSAAFRLVAEADVCSRGGTDKRAAEGGGLYAQWVRSCLGVDGGAAQVVDQAEVRPAPQEGTRASDPHGERPQLSCLEVCEGWWQTLIRG